jgi:integrase
VTIGSVAEISLQLARKEAADVLHQLRKGDDPKKKSLKITLRQALESYLAARKDLSDNSRRTYTLNVEKYLSPWADRPIRSISSEDVMKMHMTIAKKIDDKGDSRYKGQTTSNMAMRVFRLLYNHVAEVNPDMPNNPVKLMKRKWYAEHRRENFIRFEKLPTFYQAVDKLPNKVASDYLKFLLFTGLRLGESTKLKWAHIDMGQNIIRLPKELTKAKRRFELPMSTFVRDLLIGRRQILGDHPYVFPGPAAAGHLVDPHWCLSLVEKDTGFHITPHDIRRTFLTVAESCNISLYALKAMANHSVGSDITSRYIIHTPERLREDVQRVCDKLKLLCGIEEPRAANLRRLKR